MYTLSISFIMSDLKLPRDFVPLMTSSPKKEMKKESTIEVSTAAYSRETIAVMENAKDSFSKLRIMFECGCVGCVFEGH